MSETEPELGLGMVLNANPHQVMIVFRASGTTRQYAIQNAPLKRVRFREGDVIRGEGEKEHKVTGLLEDNGLINYQTSEGLIPETLLSDLLSFSTPKERLLAGHVDETHTFDLRWRAVQLQHELRKSPVRGFVGGRIALIPHQVYIAHEVTSRFAPRVLLADEVGLGKTIESCLILHRLLLTGRVSRVLILVPESLVHQWFVELLRKFNLWFAIFDEERCESIEDADPTANPFTDDQLIISSIDLLAADPRRAQQAVEAKWDLLIVDEAHHLAWSPQEPSREYLLVEQLARATPGLLLLTATPEQLGEESHFARLRLLDPERFPDLAHYLEETRHYQEVASAAAKLLEEKKPLKKDLKVLTQLLGEPEENILAKVASPETRAEIINRLLDQHGTGRVMFRNTRAAMSNFPHRIPMPELLAPPNLDYLDVLHTEFLSDANPRLAKPTYEFRNDPRILWLAEFLRDDRARKVLLICRYREKAMAIEAALRERINTKIALFHEQLPLIQRDRNAAWFAEEEGAQILIASEIGSEGRNFQFAHHLVLFDLPLDPELLEQRIGRLDRIGQTEDIKIHIPYVTGSAHEVLVRWYHEGINAFARNLSTGNEFYTRFHERLLTVTETHQHPGFNELIHETITLRNDLDARLHEGRDRLLEMHSFKPATAGQVISQISSADADERLDKFLVDVLDEFGINVEELGHRTFQLGAGDLFKDKIPALPAEGLVGTTDRTRAIARENIAFLTWDHPVVTSLFDMLLGSEKGNSTFALWPNAPMGGVMIESVYILETTAPAELHLDRYLPPTPLRIVLNHKRVEVTREVTPELLAGNLKNGDPALLSQQVEDFGSLLPGMIRITHVIAEKQARPIIESTLEKVRSSFAEEIQRLEQLRKQNPSIRQDEIDAAKKQMQDALEHLAKAAVRRDALRLIIASGPKAA